MRIGSDLSLGILYYMILTQEETTIPEYHIILI